MSTSPTRLEQTDPKAYQRKLEGLVAQRDPLDVLAETPNTLRSLVRETPAAAFHKRPFLGKWTPVEVLGHLTDAEWAMGFRTRTVLCDEHPPIAPYDQERWVAGQGHGERKPAELVDAFCALRGLNLALWRRLTSAQLQRSGHHAERGEESLGQMIRLLAGHDVSHLDQLRRYLAAAAS